MRFKVDFQDGIYSRGNSGEIRARIEDRPIRQIEDDQDRRNNGHVDMNKARYKSYGQDLTVRKGRFLFNGPVDKPWLYLEAIRVSKNKRLPQF